MSNGTDPSQMDETYFGLSKKYLIFEVGRISYAVFCLKKKMTVFVLGVSVIGIELPEIVVFASFVICFGFLPVTLYLYDRCHERDFVIAELGHTMVRPVALLSRILRVP